MKRFDLETLLDKLAASLKVKLNERIDAINLEKADTLLEKFKPEAWLFGSLDDRNMNYVDFVFYYVDQIQTRSAGGITADDYTIEIDLLVQDSQDSKIQKRMLRLHRALREAVAETWGVIGVGFDNATIESLTPIDVKLKNSSLMHKVIGISLKFSIGN